ncbi:putative GAF domain-containing protein [Neospora caninum Liverpool]|nr:putative GAF domain-containing protein [Neospora caninum Liverpool]CBZ53817.1 putative GAF domain-containing protein [Neospora caninum Liverpool]|eukprot:XP_003883849.1 putative GAF domain-containing protein [Neospora caninum Liverpool]
MVAFGLMDQFIMIRLGDFVDATLGVTFGLATLSAAAVGQLCSDTAGVVFGNTIESLAQKVGFATPPFEIYSKRAPSSTHLVRTLGAACGVAFGCLLGMSQLLFMDLDRSERLKKQQRLDAIFQMVVTDCPQLFGCERATLFVYDKSRNEIWSKAIFGIEHATRIEKGRDKSLTTWILEHKQLVNVGDAQHDVRFNPQFDAKHKSCTRSVLAAPVLGKDGDVIAVLMCINKQPRRDTAQRNRQTGDAQREADGGRDTEASLAFSGEDERVIRLLSKNIAIFMETFDYGAAEDQKVIALPFAEDQGAPLPESAAPVLLAGVVDSEEPMEKKASRERENGRAAAREGTETHSKEAHAQDQHAKKQHEENQQAQEEERNKEVQKEPNERKKDTGRRREAEAPWGTALAVWFDQAADKALEGIKEHATEKSSPGNQEAVLLSRFDLPLLGAPVPDKEPEKPKSSFWLWTGKSEKQSPKAQS